MKRCWMAVILACAMLVPFSGSYAALGAADDLARAGEQARERGTPVLLAFMQKTCPYCARARRHLEPLQASAWGGKAIMLEVDIDSTQRLRDFDGRWTTARELARRHGVRLVPTVIVFDGYGRPAADPVRGLPTEDFYTFNLERALETAHGKMNPAPAR